MDPLRPWLWANPRGLRLRDCTPAFPHRSQDNIREAEENRVMSLPHSRDMEMEIHGPRARDFMGNLIPFEERGQVPFDYTQFTLWDEADRHRSKKRRQSPSTEREDVSKPTFMRISAPRQTRVDECRLLRVRFEKVWKEQLETGLSGWSTNDDQNRVKRAKLLDTLMEQTFDKRNMELVTKSKEIETMANCQDDRNRLYNESHETALIDALPRVDPEGPSGSGL